MEILGVTRTAAEYLRDKIITGELKAGQRLNELQITEELGVSRAPVREAFRILEKDHLVESIPRKGTFVARVSEKSLDDLYVAREMIECYAIDILREKNIHNIPGLDSGFVTKSKMPIETQEDGTNTIEFWKLLSEFHATIVKACDNDWVIHFYSVLSKHLARYQILYLKIRINIDLSLKEHNEIANSIKYKHYDLAKEVLSAHLKEAHKRLKNDILTQNDYHNDNISKIHNSNGYRI